MEKKLRRMTAAPLPAISNYGTGKIKDFVGNSHGKLRCFLLILTQTVKPGRNNGVLLGTSTTL